MSERLAIDGGRPVLTRGDYRNWPIIGRDERKYVRQVLDSGILAGGTADDSEGFVPVPTMLPLVGGAEAYTAL